MHFRVVRAASLRLIVVMALVPPARHELTLLIWGVAWTLSFLSRSAIVRPRTHRTPGAFVEGFYAFRH